MSRHLWAATLAAVLAASIAAGPAMAEFRLSLGGSIPGFDPKKKLQEINNNVQAGMDKLPRNYGENPDAEKKAIDEAEAIAKKAEGDMGPTLKVAGADYDTVANNIAKLKAAIGPARLQHACSVARAAILAQHKAGKLASDAQLKALDDAAAKLVGVAGLDRAAAWWKDEAARLRQENPQIAERAAEIQRKARQQEQSKQLRKVSGDANRALAAVSEFLQKNDAPVAADLLGKLQAATAAVKGASAQAAKYYEAQLLDFSVVNAMRSGDDPGPAVAKLLGGESIKSGATTGKTLEVDFAGKQDWCYTVYVHWKGWTGGEKIDGFNLDGKGHGALQHYGWWPQNSPYQRVTGACLLKPSALHVSAALTFAGSKNGLRYAVVGWPRDKLPMSQVTYASVHVGDSCDPDAWLGMWTNPVPGSVVWVGNEPFLMSSPDRAGQSWNTLRNASGNDNMRAQKQQLSSKAPGKVAFKTQFSFRGCSRDLRYAEYPEAVAFAKCANNMDKKYGPQYDKLDLKIKSPSSLKEYGDSKKALERLKEQEGREWDSTCQPIENGIKKKMEAVFNKIVDTYTDKPYTDRLDRAGQLADENEADFDAR
ncbi:MAG: hypothetical protein HY902_09980 [Deltaproteobacteria bacterium]|nr:hypothetical protein [Deltaproteobacteria bacterium]